MLLKIIPVSKLEV